MRITIEIDSKSEMEKLTALFETLKINKVNLISMDDTAVPLAKGNKILTQPIYLVFGQIIRVRWQLYARMPGRKIKLPNIKMI